jgi:hypothetical protein
VGELFGSVNHFRRGYLQSMWKIQKENLLKYHKTQWAEKKKGGKREREEKQGGEQMIRRFDDLILCKIPAHSERTIVYIYCIVNCYRPLHF